MLNKIWWWCESLFFLNRLKDILDKIKSIISGFVLLDQTFIAFDINMLQTQEKLPDLAVDSEAMRFILDQVLSRPRNQFTHQKMKTEVGSYLVGKLGTLGLLMYGMVKSILGFFPQKLNTYEFMIKWNSQGTYVLSQNSNITTQPLLKYLTRY